MRHWRRGEKANLHEGFGFYLTDPRDPYSIEVTLPLLFRAILVAADQVNRFMHEPSTEFVVADIAEAK